MMHDDGQMHDDLEEADVVLIGVSRTSKTPTSIYLANRGVKTANIPLVPGMPLPADVEALKHPLVVGLYATPERIVQIRQNRLLGLRAHRDDDKYIDQQSVAEEVSASRRLCARHNWPAIDVTRRSIEETAAAVLALLTERRRHLAVLNDGAFGLLPPPSYWRRAAPRAGRLLEAAGIPIELCPADLDERALEGSAVSQSPTAVAALLAREKAAMVAKAHPGRLVLGADRLWRSEPNDFPNRPIVWPHARSFRRCAAVPMSFTQPLPLCTTEPSCSSMSRPRG